MTGDTEAADRRLARIALAQGNPTGWFEPLYAAAEAGDAVIPWDNGKANADLTAWLAEHPGEGKRAVVVGCGLGEDAEAVAAAGYTTTAFDVSPTGIKAARARFAESTVDYVVADLLAPPEPWRQAFDLVVEIITIQALPRDIREAALAAVPALIAPAGTALVQAFAEESLDDPAGWQGPPWPLSRAEIESMASGGVTLTSLERGGDGSRWWAVLNRAGA